MKTSMKKTFEPAYKLKVVLETYKGNKTLAQISSEYGVHITQINKWRAQFKEHGASIFSHKKDQEKQEREKLIEELYKQIGQLKVELDWLKKKSESLN